MPNLWETARSKDKKPCDNKLYLTGDYQSAFNKGKQKEVEDRYQHVKKLNSWRQM